MTRGIGALFVDGIVLAMWLFCNVVIRLKFIAFGLRISGSYNRRKKYYKTTWNRRQRLILLPFFSKKADPFFGIYFFLHYIQLGTFILVLLAFYSSISDRSWLNLTIASLVYGLIMTIITYIVY